MVVIITTSIVVIIADIIIVMFVNVDTMIKPCCHNFQYQIHDGYNPTWKYFRLLQCHELQTPSAEHQGVFKVHQEMPQDSRSPEVLPNCLVQLPYHNTHTPTQVPMVFINSTDDPIVPPPLLEIVRDAALNNPNMILSGN